MASGRGFFTHYLQADSKWTSLLQSQQVVTKMYFNYFPSENTHPAIHIVFAAATGQT